MMILRIVAAALAGLTLWCLGGTIVTLGLAWLNARANGSYWFSPHQSEGARWSSTTDNLPPAVLVFTLWPLAIPAVLIYGIALGFGRLTEKLGNKVIEAAERQAKQVRGNG